MAAPTVTKVANAILFEGDQSFTFVLNDNWVDDWHIGTTVVTL